MYRYLKKTLLAVLAIGAVVSPLSGLTQINAQELEAISVGVLQYVEHDSLDQNYQGFVDGLAEAGYVEGENLTLNYLNASADNANLQSMSENVANSSDYLFAIATPAAQSLANIEADKPILFSSVSDPIGSGLVDDLENPSKNVTGTTDAGPISEQVDLLLNIIPDAQKVGLIYNSGEANSLSEAEIAKEVLNEKGIEVVEATVISTNDISQSMESLINQEVDAVFTVTDNTIASAMTLVGDLALAADLAVIGGSKDMILENGLATYGLDYYQLGKQTAEMLVEIIEKGEIIAVQSAANLELVINETNTEKLGIDPASISVEDTESTEEDSEEE